jgi:beta-phosphoglucomutase family hydrolase
MMRAVLFDLDGVLVDSTALHFRAFRALGEEVGVPVTDAMLQSTFGKHNRDIMPMLMGRVLSDEESAHLAHRKEALYRQFAAEGLPAIPGAHALLAALALENVPMAVGSSGPRENVELGLRVLGMDRYFRCVVTGDDTPRAKPHPEIFLLAARGLGVAPEDCVVVEDAPSGITAGRAAHMKVLAVTTSRPAAELREAHRVVESLTDVTVEMLRAL